MESYRYPLTKLEKSDDYLKITALSYVPPGFESPAGRFDAPTAGDPADIKTEIASFILPIPDSIKESNVVSWGANDVNPFQALAGGLAQDLFRGKLADIKDKAMAAVGELTSGSSSKALSAFFLNQGINLLGENQNFNDTFSRYAGAITNSNIELVFTGINLREPFTVAVDMVPRSQKEALMIKNIVRRFKQLSAAKKQGVGTGNGLFLKAPEVFKLEYMHGGQPHPYLNRFKICALRSVAVSYANGTYATYADGAPVNTVLGLTFQELSPIYAEDYDKPYGLEGTGF
jgi:hypothetical protein